MNSTSESALNPNELIGTHDVLFITLDALRFDVAVAALDSGQTPNLASVLPNGRWELRHTPGNFTYAAHQAFFAGFLPTPAEPGKHSRLFAARFPGSETTSEKTCVFDSPDIVTGLQERGYYTMCIGGVGFFNKLSPLGCQLPNLFNESHWSPSLSVTERDSTRNQVDLVIERIERCSTKQRLFVFLNVSATHQPNCLYVDGAREDSVETQVAALAYADEHLGKLMKFMQRRAGVMAIITSDHGTAYGEDGYWGHRICHSTVWNVPYAELTLPRIDEAT